uniref:Uncharacterized protein n=1 Tax=Chrysotila carterae TaxID=13221 RepID=A0A7S4F0D5_CHRCT
MNVNSSNKGCGNYRQCVLTSPSPYNGVRTLHRLRTLRAGLRHKHWRLAQLLRPELVSPRTGLLGGSLAFIACSYLSSKRGSMPIGLMAGRICCAFLIAAYQHTHEHIHTFTDLSKRTHAHTRTHARTHARAHTDTRAHRRRPAFPPFLPHSCGIRSM